MLKLILTIAGGLTLLLSSHGHAQIIVNGNGEARACYQRALKDDQGRKASVQRCENALTQESLNRSDRAATYVNKGILLMRGGEHAKSLASYDKALKLKPALHEAHINRGACLIFLDRTDEAITVLTRSIETSEDHLPDALYNRAIAYERMGEVKAAYLDFKRALELRPGWTPAERALTHFQVVKKS